MASFVLVHGSWQGAWCWRRVVPPLLARGHEVIAIDLPGHGEDCSPPENVTMKDYVDRVVDAIHVSSAAPILAGHSMAATIIALAAELIPDHVRALVYVAGLVPCNGLSMLASVGDFDPEYLAQLAWSPDRRTARMQAGGARRFLYSDSPPAAIESALPLFTAEPVAPYETPVYLTEANFGRVARYSIECLRDQVLPKTDQWGTRSASPFACVYSLDADHSPFLSAPEELAETLHAIAGRT
ncbi:MAG: alpha/beta fold hydrolase [Bryobacteraceae bacterium]